MPETPFKQLSIKKTTDAKLDQIIIKVLKATHIKLTSRDAVIDYLANKELAN